MVLAATGFVVSGSLAALLLAIAGFALTWLAAGYWSAKAAAATASAEIATAQAFDGLINSRASRLPDDALVELRDIKGVLAQLLPRLKAATNAGVIGADDVFFVHQAVERYLPDAIDPYLKFSQPAAEHARMMLQQLDLVKEKMHLLTVKLDEMHALELAHNRKFLERKLKS